jgi:hypothetical protein
MMYWLYRAFTVELLLTQDIKLRKATIMTAKEHKMMINA